VIAIPGDTPDKYELPVNLRPLSITHAGQFGDMYMPRSMFTFGLKPHNRMAYTISQQMMNETSAS
jgi:hypothetical protein